MIEFLSQLHPVVQALWVGLFTWGMTALGAAAVFLTKEVNRTVLDAMLGFAAGVMIAASYWSLLSPALEMSQDMGVWRWFPAASGFLLGGAFLRGVDYFMPHLHLGLPIDKAEGIKTSFRRTTLLILAVTLHNIPEGLAVGVAIGAAAAGLAFRDSAGRLGAGFWYRNSEYAGRISHLGAASERGAYSPEKFSLWSNIWDRRAFCQYFGRGGCVMDTPGPAVCPGFCGGGYDLCRGGGGHPGIPTGREHGYLDDGCDAGLRHYDDFRRGAGVRGAALYEGKDVVQKICFYPGAGVRD